MPKDRIKIDGVEYQHVLPPDEARMRIVIVNNRGLTFVGRCVIDNDAIRAGGVLIIHDAKCLIRWGTSEHLAQLVNGPTPDTSFGQAQTVNVPIANVVAWYDASEEGWR